MDVDPVELPSHQIYDMLSMDVDPRPDSPSSTDERSAIPTVSLPSDFIFVKHHPHANKPNEIIPIDGSSPAPSFSKPDARSDPTNSDDRPWAPFQSYADYKFTSRCVRRRTPNSEINEDLRDLHHHAFSSDCFVSFGSHRDMEKSLAAARASNIPFCCQTLVIDFDGDEFGGRYEVEIEFRDPWQIMKQWVSDETLATVSTWFSSEKYRCKDGKIDFSNRLYDEPCTGRLWGAADDSLPLHDRYPSSFLGLHVWLDKGLVSTKVKMHPILFRGCWIHSATPRKPAPNRSKHPQLLRRSEYDRLKRIVYRGVCHLVMASLEQRSHSGEALCFGDGVTRVAYPGVLIESMDFEEMAAWLCLRNSVSLHPCPQCLVHKDDLPRLTATYPDRTSESMSRALERAPVTKTDRNKHLQQYGLHDFVHFLWKFNNSDPYRAVGYDCLHFFDGGIWGRHMWLLIKAHLQNTGLASKFNEKHISMAKFPRWRNLKHLSSPTTIDYSEGQTFLDILKILPANSCLVRLVRIMIKIRTLLALSVMLDSRSKHLQKFIADYEKICADVSRKHDKSLNFLKQHFLSHAIRCFEDKGTSRNQNTRVGEGFQQEIAAQYLKTNGKDAEHQMSCMDENEETMARLDMRVNEWQRAKRQMSWIQFFRRTLLQHIGDWAPPIPEQPIEPCKVLYIDFQSKVDWNSDRDILRCNPKFHGRPRYDSIIYEADGNDLAMGQLELIFRCHLPHQKSLDLAMIRPYCNSSWTAKTRTDCPIREWGAATCSYV
ncbi:hypothetical protein B0H14DRAFT_2574409 [Mycena olivaceomarginata]|nr:hypothetical protein B0H14DRAFT_2574409 [Mycena olivaceomarginata]